MWWIQSASTRNALSLHCRWGFGAAICLRTLHDRDCRSMQFLRQACSSRFGFLIWELDMCCIRSHALPSSYQDLHAGHHHLYVSVVWYLRTVAWIRENLQIQIVCLACIKKGFSVEHTCQRRFIGNNEELQSLGILFLSLWFTDMLVWCGFHSLMCSNIKKEFLTLMPPSSWSNIILHL
jgi:hypothetical protein